MCASTARPVPRTRRVCVARVLRSPISVVDKCIGQPTAELAEPDDDDGKDEGALERIRALWGRVREFIYETLGPHPDAASSASTSTYPPAPFADEEAAASGGLLPLDRASSTRRLMATYGEPQCEDNVRLFAASVAKV